MRELKGLPRLYAEAQIDVAREPRRPQVDHGVQLQLLPDDAAAVESPSNDLNGEGQNRTGDTTIFSRVLYQLSYLAEEAARRW